jgi:hypothetical protein
MRKIYACETTKYIDIKTKPPKQNGSKFLYRLSTKRVSRLSSYSHFESGEIIT